MTLVRSLLPGIALLTIGIPVVRAYEPPQSGQADKVSYYRDVRRIFQQHCQGCHQPAKPMGGYVMTSHAELLKAGERGTPGVVPNKPDKSTLYEQIVPKDGKRAAMPKGKDPLPAGDVEIVKRWIAEGA